MSAELLAILLRDIIHELALNKDALLALGALAAIASPFVALRIADKNLKGTFITNQRREWINEVRNEVAGILAALGPLQVDSPSPQHATRMINLMDELELRRAKSTLLMDPQNSAQCELLAAATNAIKHAHEAREAKSIEIQKLKAAVEADVDKLIDTTQAVLAEAWEKARSLK